MTEDWSLEPVPGLHESSQDPKYGSCDGTATLLYVDCIVSYLRTRDMVACLLPCGRKCILHGKHGTGAEHLTAVDKRRCEEIGVV